MGGEDQSPDSRNQSQNGLGGVSKHRTPGDDSGVDPVAPTAVFDASFAPRQGDLVDGMYLVQRRIGSGGMGGVVLARDRQLERDVAIKFILPHLTIVPGVKERFLAEARTMARFRHDNVVAIHALGTVGDVPYIVMEYVPGISLAAHLEHDAGMPLSISDVIRILRQLCTALDAVHAHGVIHRDLKPSNVLIGPGFRIVLTDFGLASSLMPGSSAQHSPIIGTPAYVSPEVLDGKRPTPASDIYSLGVLTHHMLTGSLPFEGTTSSVLTRHSKTVPRHPSLVYEALPRSVGDVILAALDKDPTRRPPSARALLERLVAASNETGVAPPKERHFLIADDDEDIRMLVEGILDEVFPGAVLATVADGQEALDYIRTRAVSAAVIDLQMPGLNGVELTLAIRTDPRISQIPIVVMTAVGGAPDWQVLRTLGANAFVVKPFQPDELLAAIRRVTGWG